MHRFHDIDALLLLALSLASKRRPAELVEIVAAADLLQGFIPFEAKLREAFARLATHGLLAEADGGYALTPAAQELMAGQPKKAEAAERVVWTKERLAAYAPQGEHPPILLTTEQLVAAMTAHRAAAKGAGRNLLMPKPKAEERDHKRFGQWRKPAAPRRRKA